MGVQLPSEPITRKEQYLAKAAGQAVEIPSEPITREEAYLDAIAKKPSSGGTSDYSQLTNLPKINGTTLVGNKSASDLSLASTADLAVKVDKVDGKVLSTNDYTDADKTIVDGVTDALAGKQDTLTFDDVPTTNSNNPVKSGGVKNAIDAAVASAYHHAGTKTCAELVAGLLVAGNEGNVYNMTDSGTTTADFIEGAGQPIKAGDNVGVCKVSDGVYKFDLLSGFVDTTNFVQKSETVGLIKNDGTIDTVEKQPKTDNNLTTTSKDTTGAVNELKSGLTNLDNEVNGNSITYPYADVITINDAVPANLADCSVKIEPDQDLHGYDKPWVGGAGKNKLQNNMTNGSSGGVTYSVNSDGTISCSGKVTNSGYTKDINERFLLPVGTYILSGSSSSVGFRIYLLDSENQEINRYTVYGTDQTFEIGSNVAWIKLVAISGSVGADVNVTLSPMIRLSTEQDATFAPYTNICPITGHTEASVQRDGVNLCPVDSSSFTSGSTWCNLTGGNANAPLNGTPIKLKAGNYAIRPFNRSNMSILQVYNSNGVKLVDAGTDGDTFVLASEETVYIRASTSGSGSVVSFNTMLAVGTSIDAFEPYQGKTYTIALGDTIYGGTVDFDTGKVRVTHFFNTLKGTENFSLSEASGNNPRRFTRTLNDLGWGSKKTNTVAVSNMFKYLITFSSTDEFGTFRIINNLGFADSNSVFADATEFNTWLATQYANDTPVEICYELATPFTIQLTPQQIQLLKGTNTLTASTGQISVTANGVSGSIGAVQEQVNETYAELAELAADIAEQLPDAPTTDGAYVLTVTVADGTPTYSWESAS